jgi:hypothetical protein
MAAELNFFVQGIKSEKEFADPIRAEVSVLVQARRRPLAGVYLLLCDVDICFLLCGVSRRVDVTAWARARGWPLGTALWCRPPLRET